MWRLVYLPTMNLVFDYPKPMKSLGVTLATKAYADIWQQDGAHLVRSMEMRTGLQFQQDQIHVIVHDGQSMSGMDGRPMRLNIRNRTLVEKQCVLVHELCHRLLFGNGLYAPESEGPEADETRVLLFQGDVLRDVYGDEVYSSWANLDPEEHTAEYIRTLSAVLSLSPAERQAKIKEFTGA